MSNHTITVNYDDMKFDVEFDYYPGSLARRGEAGLPMEPDEPATWEILKISIINPDSIDVAPVDVTYSFTAPMMDYFDDQIGDYIGSYL
jgi:hypothetical protein